MLKPGDRFGSYRVLRLLGRGGMGTVFLLESSSGALVAVKILDPESSGDHESRRRFLREAELALGVKHQHLIETYDIGEDPDTGLCYILMEYAPGGTLADRIDNGPLAIMDAIRIVYQIASVLELARQKGIVHRDIKPENIMFGADGKAKLSDLGIARGGLSGIQTTMVTHTGMMIGTPAYMAPEQMFDAHNVDVRADIYSLGIVFYEMLAGERPNADDTAVQLMAKAVKGEPIPDVRTLRPEVSAAVAELVSLMCAMKVDERISTPIEVTTALSQIVHGHEVTIVRKRPSVMPKKSAPRGGSSRKVATAVVGMVAVVGIAAFMYFGLNERSSRVSPSVQPENARTPPSIDIKTNEVVKIVEKVVERTVEKKVESKTTALEPKALPTDVAVVIGCDDSLDGGKEFYARIVQPRNLSRFNLNARVVPLLFKLTSEVLEKVNLLVLSPGRLMLDENEQKAVGRFVEAGGVVLALVHSMGCGSGESRETTAIFLKQYGATVYNAPRDPWLGVRLANTLAAYGTMDSKHCTAYASCSADWTPLAVASDDSKKVVCAVRQVGAGFLILAPAAYAENSIAPDVMFPWNKVLSSRLKPVRRPDDSFVGSTLDDAPYEARSSRMRFVSSVVSVEGLRWIAEMDDAAVEILTRRFGAGSLAANSVKNCIVYISTRSWSQWDTENRLKELDAVVLSTFNPDPKRSGFWKESVVKYIERTISPRRVERYQPRSVSVAGYMAAVVYDELRSSYSFRWGPGMCGAAEQIEAARKHDPGFVRYDAEGNPKTAGTPELNKGEKQQYASGRFFAMLEDLHKRKPDLFVRYHQVESGWNYDAHSYAAVIDALCTAYGSDLPRRWPDRDGKSLSK